MPRRGRPYRTRPRTWIPSDTSAAIQMRKVDAFTAEAELSLAGRIVGRTRRVFSQDGQTMTIELRRNAPAVVNNVTVYRRR